MRWQGCARRWLSPNFRCFPGPVLIFALHHVKPLVATPVVIVVTVDLCF